MDAFSSQPSGKARILPISKLSFFSEAFRRYIFSAWSYKVLSCTAVAI